MATYTMTDSTSLTWAKVKEIIKMGRASQEFAVGDEFAETLMTGEEVVFVVAGINVYKDNQVIFSMKDCLTEGHRMNKDWTNTGGWLASNMRKHLNKDVYVTLPAELRSVISPRTLHSGEKSGRDRLWLFSAYEILGEDWCNKEEMDNEKHLPYYRHSIYNRCKKWGKDGSAYYWWLRSPYATHTTTFCTVNSSGTAGSANGAASAFGVAAGFCI